MFIDRMHSDAIRDADASSLPMTVYRVGSDWSHSNALWVREQIREYRRPDCKMVAVVTWLPERYFS